jgi:linoleoyl-CoA desaturase
MMYTVETARMTTSNSRYLPHGPFFLELRKRVDAHFTASGRIANQTPAQMYLKTGVILSWFIGSWVLLNFAAQTWWQAALCCVSLGLAAAGIGFSIQHDGGHRGYSRHRWVNGLMAFFLDVLGGSSYIWHWKHNVFHHANPNITGLDVDIDIRPLARMSPEQKRRFGHRFQHIYIWVLYAFLAVKWHFFDDFSNIVRGKIGDQTFPRPKGWKLAQFIIGKAVFVTWALVVPALLHPWPQVVLGYALASATLSVTLAVVFQLAHVVEGAQFPKLEQECASKMEWAVHQVVTSANFALGNPLVTWYVGGLNYQIEHHLFPKVCHYRLPEIAPIVQQLCREQGIPYQVNASTFGAIASHTRWIRQLGMAS